MSTIAPEDLETTGYFLPEDTHLRLKKLREYAEFLANLARPRQADEGKEWHADIRPGDVTICLEQLEEQIAQVLEELSWPAERGKKVAAPEADSMTQAHENVKASGTEAAASDTAESAAKRYLSSVTLNQIDQMNLLLESLHALGNVVTCADHAELSKATLSIMGDAICRDVDKLHGIVDDIYESQRLDPRRAPQTGVREAQASYLALPIHSPMAGTSSLVREHPTYQ